MYIYEKVIFLVVFFMEVTLFGCNFSEPKIEITYQNDLTMRQFLLERNVSIPSEARYSEKMDTVFLYVSKALGPTPEAWKKSWNKGENLECGLWVCGNPSSGMVSFFFSNFPPPIL